MIAALPGTWPDQIPGSTFGPSLTWAGGTPDETLNPPPTPPQSTTPPKSKRTTYATDGGNTAESVRAVSTDHRRTTWSAFWRMLRATMLRI